MFGSGAAVVLRIVLTLVAVQLLAEDGGDAGEEMMIRLMERFPIVVTFGAALIGWVGGETVVSDKVLGPLLENAYWMHQAGPALSAALVLLLGRWLQKRHDKEEVPAP